MKLIAQRRESKFNTLEDISSEEMLSDMFYVVNFSLSILTSIFGMVVSISMIVIIATHRPLRTVTNLLTCNTSMTILIYFINILTASV